MKANKIGLVNNNGDYELVNTDLFPYDSDSNEECKNNLICDDLLSVLEIHKFLLEHDYSTLPREDFDLLFKKAKALEIIKNKIDILGRNGYLFNKEEYDLLKETLL